MPRLAGGSSGQSSSSAPIVVGSGWSVSSQTALTNTIVSVKSSSGNFGGYMIYNPNATVAYVQVFDSTSATIGVTVPTYVIPIPAISAANLTINGGIGHSNGISVAATTTPTGSTAPTSALAGFMLYK